MSAWFAFRILALADGIQSIADALRESSIQAIARHADRSLERSR